MYEFLHEFLELSDITYTALSRIKDLPFNLSQAFTNLDNLTTLVSKTFRASLFLISIQVDMLQSLVVIINKRFAKI